MNGLDVLLDTNVIIGLLKGNPEALAILTDVNLDASGYSAITRMELLSFPGLTDEEALVIQQLLSRMVYLPISPEIEDLTIEFRKQTSVKLPDAIIVATAESHRLRLLTLDKKLAAKI